MTLSRKMERVRGFRGDIEGLRGVAVLLVVADHVLGWPRGGFLGVDVFFVLSGFLITGLLVAESERNGRISLRGFYARRARRLVPVAVLVLVVTDLAAAALLLPARAHATVVDSLWALGSAANLWFAHLGTDYFAQNRPPSPVQHYWSLSVEEQFYVVWPSLLLLTLAVARRRGWSVRCALSVVAGAVVAGSFAWSVVTAGSSYFSSPARAWELGVGALLALAAPSVAAARHRHAVGLVSGAALAVSVLVIGPRTPVPGFAAALPVLATAGLLHAAPAALAWSPLRWFGRISYSLYLWHWPVLVLAADLPGGDTGLAQLACVLLAVALSAASYRWIETPVRASQWLSPRTGRQTPRRRLVAPAWALLTVLALGLAYGLTAAAPSSTRARPSDGTAAALTPLVAAGLALRSWPPGLGGITQDAAAPEWVRDGCLDVGARNERACTYGPKGATKDVVLLGDSIAISWMPGLREVAAVEGWRVHVLTRRQCPAVMIPGGQSRAVSQSCAGHQRWATARARELRPVLVIAASRYGGATPAQWESGLAASLRALGNLPVAVLEPPPDTGNLQECHTRLSSPQQCIEPVTALHTAFSTAERAAAAAGGARFVDTTAWFCLGQRCPAVIDGLPVHADGEHLSAVYARLLGASLRRALVS